jgi:hypothetical protein
VTSSPVTPSPRVDARTSSKVQGVTFSAAEIEEVVLQMLGITTGTTADEEDVAS